MLVDKDPEAAPRLAGYPDTYYPVHKDYQHSMFDARLMLSKACPVILLYCAQLYGCKASCPWALEILSARLIGVGSPL